MKLSPVTGGAEVKDNLETSVPGIFSCGNVLHVHDLVDYVSEEAERAGKNAAEFIKNGDKAKEPHMIRLKGENGVRYTVPQEIDAEHMDEKVIVRFRVGDDYKDKNLVIYFDDRKVKSTKKRIMAPGEMEQIVITKDSLTDTVNQITIRVED